jgi:hypothetical protein
MTQPGMTADYIKIIQTPMRTQTCLFGLEVSSREEFWRYLNHNLSSLFSIFKYHFGKRGAQEYPIISCLSSVWLKDSFVYLQILMQLPFLLLPCMDSFHHRSKSKSYQDLLEYSEPFFSFFEYQIYLAW